VNEENSVWKSLYGRTPFIRINCEGSQPDMQKILIIGFFLKIDYTGSLKLGRYYLQYLNLSTVPDLKF